MKKFIAIMLMLTLCLGLFAGCEPQPTEPSQPSDLENAKTYLFKMYNTAGKDEENKFLADKDVTSVVMIGGVSYPVTWTVEVTAGPADSVKIVESENANFVKVDIMDQPEEELHFVLTATVKNEAGESASMSLKCFTPAVKKVEVTEDKIVLFNPDGGVYVTGTDYLYTSSSGSQKHELEVSADKSAALQLTVRKNDDGTVTFVTGDGKFLMADGTNVQIVDAEGDHTKFVLEAAENGQFIKCANATYNDKPQYLEIYSGYLTCYGMNESKAAIYTFQMEVVADQGPILDAAYGLGEGETLAGGPFTLTGVISSIDTEWSEQYKNITVTIVCDGDTARPIQCYRLQGEGAATLAVGDTITVTGELKNYSGTIEFDAKCNLDKVVKAEGGEEKPEEPTTPAEPQLPEVTDPAEGTAYKFGMIQVKNGHTVYLAGGIDQERFLTTTTDKAAALDVFVEKVDGGIKISTTIDGAKVYITLGMNEAGKTALGFGAEGTVFQFDATTCVWFTNLDGTDYYIGSYNTFDTMSPSKTSYINAENSGIEQFPAGFFAA